MGKRHLAILLPIVLAAIVLAVVLYPRPSVPSEETEGSARTAQASDGVRASGQGEETKGSRTSEPAGQEGDKERREVEAPPVPQPPEVKDPAAVRRQVEDLLARQGDVAREKMAELYPAANAPTRRLIERHAAQEDPKLKETLAAQSAASLDSEDSGKKLAGLETLRFLAVPDGADKALALLSDEEPAEVCTASIAYLGRVNHEEAFEKILSLAGAGADVAVRATAVRNLPLVGGKKHPDKTVSALSQALDSDSPAVQAEVLRSLGRFLERITPEIEKRVRELAQIEPDTRERKYVKEAAGMLLEHLEAAEEHP